MDLDIAHANKAIPPLRESDLFNITSPTRYEKSLAAPSDEELVGYWLGWAIVSFISGLFVVVVFSGILSSRHARSQPFNLYLLYLMIPDFCLNFLCGITCFMNASKGSYWSHWMCNFQHWYAVAGISINCWLNAVITYQLHRLLRASSIGLKFQIPTNRTVTIQSLAVYLYCSFLGTWGLLDGISNFSYGAIQIKGLTCTPSEVDPPSSLFFWLFYMPLFCIIPTFYIVYVSIDIWRRKLLPPRGKRRMLAVYYGRIVMVFLLFWGPYFLITYVLSPWVPASVLFAGGVIAHLQSFVSASVSMLKPDIYAAVKNFVTCRCGGDFGTERVQESGWTSSDRIFSRISSSGSLFPFSKRLNISSRNVSSTNVQSEEQQQQQDDSEQTQQQEQRSVSPSIGTRGSNYVSIAAFWPNEDGEYTSGDEDEGLEEYEEDKGGDTSENPDIEMHVEGGLARIQEEASTQLQTSESQST